MFKKIAMTAPLAVLALSSSMAFGATDVRHTINIFAKVPTVSFYVVPSPGLTDQDQDMSYHPGTGKMKEVNGYFDMRHTAGSISASLDYPAKLFGGANQIPLKVTVNNKILTLTPQEVAGVDESNDNFRASLNIAPEDASTVKPGDYTGTVALNFDAVII